MSYKDWTGFKKGLLIGFIISVLILIISLLFPDSINLFKTCLCHNFGFFKNFECNSEFDGAACFVLIGASIIYLIGILIISAIGVSF